MDIDFINTAMIPVIVGICCIVGYLVKTTVNNDRVHDFIPCMVTVLGLILALVNMVLTGQEFSLMVVFSGMVSGLASTGLWELITHLVREDK